CRHAILQSITQLPDYSITRFVQQFVPDPRDHIRQTSPGLQIGEHERFVAAHRLRIARHDLEAGADVRGEIDLFEDEQTGSRDAGPALAWNLVAARDVDHVD